MTNTPTTLPASISRQPEPLHQALDISLSRAVSALDLIGSLTPADLPSGPRVALTNRRKTLRAALAPSTHAVAARTLATLAAMAFRGQATREMLAAIAKQDVADLTDLPAWALEAACRAYRLAEVGDGHWRPTSGQLRALAIKRVEPFAREMARIARVLDAPLALAAPSMASAEQRERVAAGLRELSARMGGAP